MDRLVKLGDFLRACRARINPEEVGIHPQGVRRRVRGLRREELARLAGVSVEYYTSLEQGRSLNASPVILDAIARAMRLGETERVHLFDLASPRCGKGRCDKLPAQRMHPETQLLLDTLERADVPAAVIGRGTDILAANLLFRALMVGFDTMSARQRNLARYVFLDGRARELHCDWDTVASEVTAVLRFSIGRHPEDAALIELTSELCRGSEDFRRIWDDHDYVHERVSGIVRFQHPVAGELALTYQALTLPTDAEQMLLVYTVEPGSPTAAALQLLVK
ncbi:helix-turn-helix transcriptional regulator [Planotetraspora phitsanulokensis]|uniref:Transcriptional regulator n=1 Tax=Planotetraspora phitsanulokensis TaxID=575192 RepID=A0A8J3U1A1_9ACTN|nr:helix-turn-helix transcriptional regulator [Planotetraspora phitsanulokensis]GII35551.1 transcriptional regulator [Planotetraspora phitsanulokensis]